MTSQRILGFCCLILLSIAEVNTQGTTRDIETIFKGKCLEYQRVINPSAFSQGLKDCEDLWTFFSDAFMYKDPCNVTQDDYLPYVEAAFHNIPRDSHLFWEGVYPFANRYADNGRRFYALAGTLTGYPVDNLMWCGQVEPPGINYETCPEDKACENSADASFWKMASEWYADAAEGESFVMLNASYENAFLPTSIFAEHELTFIDKNKVSRMTALYVTDIGVTPRESCGEGSLLVLKDIVENEVGIQFDCIDNPDSTRHMLCIDNSEHPQCSNSDKSKSQALVICLMVYALHWISTF